MAKVFNVLISVIGISILLMLSLFWYFNTTSGQKYLTTKVNDYIQSKIESKFSIGAIRYSIPDYVILEDVYLEDLSKVQLLQSKKFQVDLSMWALLRGIVDIDQVIVENTKVNLYRKAGSEVFNYQFILDALISDTVAVQNPESSSEVTFALNQVKVTDLEFSYLDDYGGVNFKSKIGSGRVNFSSINPNTNKYHINNIDLKGGYAIAKTFNPVVFLTEPESTSEPLDLDLNGIKFRDFRWRLKGDDLGLDNTIFFKEFDTVFKTFDLDQKKIAIERLSLDNSKVTLAIRPNTTVPVSQSESNNLPWDISLNNFWINESQIIYDDNNAKKLVKGFDANHIDFRKTKIDISGIHYTEKEVNLKIREVNFTDRSSLKLEKFRANISYTDKGIVVNGLDVRTPFSKIISDVEIKFSGIQDFTDNLENVNLNLQMKQSDFALSDILLLNPALSKEILFKNPKGEKIRLEASLKGSLKSLLISKLKMKGLQGSSVDISGKLAGLDNLDNLKVDLKVDELATNSALIKLIVGDEALLSAYNIPDKISLKGNLKGDAKLLNLDAKIVSTLGDISFEGTLKDVADQNLIQYEGTLHTVDLAVNKFFKEDLGVGVLSTDIFLKSDATFQDLTAKGQIHKLEYSDYLYQDLDIDGTLVDSVLNLNATSLDPNAQMNATILVDLKGNKYPIKGQVFIDKLNMAALHLYDLKEDVSGVFNFDMESLMAEDLEGNLDIKGLVLGDLKVGALTGNFTNNNGSRLANIESPFLKVKLNGEFNYYELPTILMNEANGYFKLDSVATTEISGNHNFTLAAVVLEHPIWGILIPDLKFEKNIMLNSGLNGNELIADMAFGNVAYGDILLKDFQMNVTGNGQTLKGKATLKSLHSGGMDLPNDDLNIDFANGILEVQFVSKDIETNNRMHSVGMSLEKVEDLYKIYLNELTVDKKVFKINNVPIYYGEKGILTSGLTMSSNAEQLVLNSNENQMKVRLIQININPFTNFLGYQSDEIKGTLNGEVTINDYLNNYQLTGAFIINKFEIGGIEGGDLTLNLDEIDAEHVKLSGGVDGRDSRLSFKGVVGLSDVAPIDFNVDVTKVDARFIQSFSGGELRNSKGFVTGNLKVGGTADKPVADGKLAFVDFNFTPNYLGIPLKIEDQQLYFKGNKINFENFIVKDSLNQKMSLQGGINWSDLDRISYDIKLNAKNFLLIDTKKGSNELFYGKANIDANLHLEGIGSSPNVTGKIKANEQSNVTFIMPSEIETAVSNGVVSFVPPTKTEEELKAEKIEIPTMQLENGTGLASEIILDIETDPKAQLNIIIDELSGDNLKIKGTANLTVGIYPTGEIFALGVYEIVSGSYDFSIDILRKTFEIVPGSMLIWSGDPYQASLQIKALYEVNADIQSINSAFDLSLDGFGKVPIDIILNIDGTIQNPLISFDLRTSAKAESSIKSQIENVDAFASVRKNQTAMNQQVFSLLLSSKFSSLESIDLFSSLSAQSIARQSVSKILTEQLNALAGNVLGSVGLNFGLSSDQLSTVDGEAYRTNLNVGLKKSFLNDRVKVSVGKNFELENSSAIDQNSAELLDNIEVGYNITADGRYVVKIYRNSQFQTVLEGFVLETGVSFVLTSEYDNIKELFKKTKPLK